ncbi:hypothetical protein LY78DRAFT_289896 [Colletotrichum sublineola]|nr:hypothetical protein LY78DRAFT_289896 [Colletotrichum sublineola]
MGVHSSRLAHRHQPKTPHAPPPHDFRLHKGFPAGKGEAGGQRMERSGRRRHARPAGGGSPHDGGTALSLSQPHICRRRLNRPRPGRSGNLSTGPTFFFFPSSPGRQTLILLTRALPLSSVGPLAARNTRAAHVRFPTERVTYPYATLREPRQAIGWRTGRALLAARQRPQPVGPPGPSVLLVHVHVNRTERGVGGAGGWRAAEQRRL